MSSRKRRAPGASPQVQQSTSIRNSGFSPETNNISADQYMNNWNDPTISGDVNTNFGDPSLFDGINFTGNAGVAAGQSSHNRIVSLDNLDNGLDTGAGQLVRRNPNQQLAARGRDPWDDFNNNASAGQPGQWETVDDDEELEQKAILAKKDAQSKRKSIPPFVQKLSSFLDEKNNTNLIRWSDDGNSFIVLDEDEFARTLIPELFKHNNYASFVRQLNMYGFHKKVGLSDNSMKASETKAKAPSEYFNKYFKRGRPELLWLIQKPKNPPTNVKRKRGEDDKNGDSDEDRKYLPDTGGGGSGGGYVEDLSVRGNSEMAMIPRTEYNSLRGEVQALQNQQKVISNVLTQIKRQNEELYSQANTFRTLHERHENSINAILTFLATFYNRSLEGQNNSVNFADMFGPAIPAQQPHGNVVDVGDYPEEPVMKSPQMSRPTPRRPLALLPAPAVKDSLSPTNRAATLSPSIRSTASPLPKSSNRPAVFKGQSNQTRPPTDYNNRPMRDGASTGPLKVETTSPPNLGQSPENDVIMSAIQNVNANNPQTANRNPGYDLSAALSNYQTQDGNVPLTTQQRADVLSLMNSATGASQSTNNALVSPQPPLPSLEQFQATAAQLDFLQKMSEDQNSRVQNLQERLQPLSPSGSIPGLTDSSYFGASALGDPGAYDLDLDSFVQGDDFFPNNNEGPNGTGSSSGDIALPDLNFELPDTNQGMDGVDFENAGDGGDYGAGMGFNGTGEGRIESVSSSATSPTATVEDAEDESVAKRQTPKRRKK